MKKTRSLEEKLNFINEAKKTKIAKDNPQSIEFARKRMRIRVRKHFEHDIRC